MSKRAEQPVVGIIGGAGEMGQWFVRWFRTHGLSVIISDLQTPLSNEQLIAQADVVVFAVPIRETATLIRQLAPLGRPEQLWLDITSLKKPAVDAMLRSKAEVLGTHPMFGPSVKSFQGQTIILTPGRLEHWRGWLEALLEQDGAKLKQTEPAEHDRMMTVIQGLTHFSAITMAYALRLMDIDVEESLSYTSPVYRIHLDTMGRLLEQDPSLYADIQIDNPLGPQAIEHYMQAAGKLFRLLEDRDKAAFMRYFRQAADHIGPYKQTAYQESNRLIDLLAADLDHPTHDGA